MMVDWNFALQIISFGVILVFIILISLAIIMRLIEEIFGKESNQQQSTNKAAKWVLKKGISFPF